MQQIGRAGGWDAAGAMLADAARALERAGAQCVVICANTGGVAGHRRGVADRWLPKVCALTVPYGLVRAHTSHAPSSLRSSVFGLPGFDTTRLHAEAAVSFALE